MKTKIRFVLIFIFIFYCAAAGRCYMAEVANVNKDMATPAIQSTGAKVSMDFENTAIKDVLKAFSRQTGISFIATDAIQSKKITVFLNKVSIDEALDCILDANGLTYEKQPGGIYLIKPSGTDLIKKVTRVFKLNYLQVYKMVPQVEAAGGTTTNMTIIGQPAISAAGTGETVSANPAESSASSESTGTGGADQPRNIIGTIHSLMSKYGRIVADRRTNSLIITDIPSVMGVIEKTIKELDVEPEQVMIQAEIIETTTDALKRIGLEYGSETQLAKITYTGSGGAGSSNPTFPTPFPFTENFIKDTFNQTLAGSGIFKYGTIKVADMDIVLKALSTDDDTKYLARPRIMTINNESAIIRVSANTAIGITSSSVTQTGETISTAERAETGIVLKVTPQINEKGDIFMYMEPSVSRAIESDLSTQFMDPSYRSSASTVMVRDGETIIIGGLIGDNVFKTVRKIPILGDIPILGEPFKSRYNEVKNTEILIFVTPHLVKKRDYEYRIPEEKTARSGIIQKTLDRYAEIKNEKKKKEEPRKEGDSTMASAMDNALRAYSKGRGNAVLAKRAG